MDGLLFDFFCPQISMNAMRTTHVQISVSMRWVAITVPVLMVLHSMMMAICVQVQTSFCHSDCVTHWHLSFLIALPCRFLLTHPINGELQCPEGQFTHAKCSFICNAGYQLMGAEVLTCYSDGSWSDQPPSCQLLQCQEPFYLSPPNGFIRLPCFQDYNSVCKFGCFSGYNLTGSDTVICTGSEMETLQWMYASSKKSTCKS